MATDSRWEPTSRLQEELLELDRDLATEPLAEVVLRGRLPDLFADWTDFADHCLAALRPAKPVVWTGPHVFLTTGLGISDLVDSWHDAVLHLHLTRGSAARQCAAGADDDGAADVTVCSVYVTREEHSARGTVDGLCRLLGQCRPAMAAVELSMLLHPPSALGLSQLVAGHIDSLEVATPRGAWSGPLCRALAAARPEGRLEVLVDALDDEAQILCGVLTRNGGPSRLRLGPAIGWGAFQRLAGALAGNTRLQSLTVLDATGPHLAALAAALADNYGLEELALVGTLGDGECDTMFQDLMQAVSRHAKLASLTLGLQLPSNVSDRRVMELSRWIEDMVISSKTLTYLSLPLDYAFLEHMTLDVDRYLDYNRHTPRARALRASDLHPAVLAPVLAAVQQRPELVHLFLQQAVGYLCER